MKVKFNKYSSLVWYRAVKYVCRQKGSKRITKIKAMTKSHAFCNLELFSRWFT